VTGFPIDPDIHLSPRGNRHPWYPPSPDTENPGHSPDQFPRGDPAEIATATADPVGAFLWLIGRARPSWHDQAACVGSDIDFTSRVRNDIDAALQVCGRCPARAECLEWALDLDDNDAVLGGTDHAARRQIAKQRRTASTPAPQRRQIPVKTTPQRPAARGDDSNATS
jgi:WhiB family redox-sensing transcriptional regulator